MIKIQEKENTFDVIIIGAGPAGLSAAIYASRYNLKTLVISPIMGGQITESIEVENYPGTKKASGFEMMEEWKSHAETFGAKLVLESVSKIEKDDNFIVSTYNNKYYSKAIICATGSSHKHLGVKGEKEFFGKGVSYCPTCDGMFFSGKTIAVIGGGDAALRGVQVMTKYSEKIFLIHRRNEFRAEPILVDKIKSNNKVEILTPFTVKEIIGDKTVEGLVLNDDKQIKVNGVFIEIGNEPVSSLIKNLNIELDESGYIKTKKDQSTNIDGFFAAGDVTTNSNKFRQVITAASEGAIAADSVFKHLNK